MRLDPDACWTHLRAVGHGVLGTVHPARGVDAVPVVFVVDDTAIIVPIDAVKPKSGRRLQRLGNLDGDDRAVLLVEHYEDDWSRLWWVRVHGRAREAAPTSEQRAALGRSFPAYDSPGAVTSVIVLASDAVTGWAAAP